MESKPRPRPPSGYPLIDEELRKKGGPCFLIDKPGGIITNLGNIISETPEKVTFRSEEVSKDDFKYLIPVFCGDVIEISFKSHNNKNIRRDLCHGYKIDNYFVRNIRDILPWLILLMDAQRELRAVIKMNPTTTFGIYQREKAEGILEKNHINEIMSIIGNYTKEQATLLLEAIGSLSQTERDRLTSAGIPSMLSKPYETGKAAYIYGKGETFYGFDEYIAPHKYSRSTVPIFRPSGASSGNSSSSSGGRRRQSKKSIKARKARKTRKGKKGKKQSRRRV